MSRFKIILIWLIFTSPFLVLFTLVQLTSLGIFGELPSFEQLENPKNNLATEIISEDGIVLGKYFFENRSRAKYNEIPENLINALISTEDVRFREHSGIDGRALLRAIFGVIMGNSSSGGASTITQQLAKMLFTQQPSSGAERVMQKLKEWIISAQLERRYTKDEILTMYLNRFDWVNNAVGIKSASQVYFNKKPIELKLEESGMINTVPPPSANLLSELINPDEGFARPLEIIISKLTIAASSGKFVLVSATTEPMFELKTLDRSLAVADSTLSVSCNIRIFSTTSNPKLYSSSNVMGESSISMVAL